MGPCGVVPRAFLRLYPLVVARLGEADAEDGAGRALQRDARGLCLECFPGEPGELLGEIRQGDPSRTFDGYADAQATRSKIARNVSIPFYSPKKKYPRPPPTSALSLKFQIDETLLNRSSGAATRTSARATWSRSASADRLYLGKSSNFESGRRLVSGFGRRSLAALHNTLHSLRIGYLGVGLDGRLWVLLLRRSPRRHLPVEGRKRLHLRGLRPAYRRKDSPSRTLRVGVDWCRGVRQTTESSNATVSRLSPEPTLHRDPDRRLYGNETYDASYARRIEMLYRRVAGRGLDLAQRARDPRRGRIVRRPPPRHRRLTRFSLDTTRPTRLLYSAMRETRF